MSKILNLKDSNTIADLRTVFKDVALKYPLFMEFLEQYCGYDFPVLSTDPNEIVYSSGKRDVILTIKTISRDDIEPEAIAALFEKE